MVVTTPGTKIPWYRRWELPGLLPAILLALLMVWAVTGSIATAGWAEGLTALPGIALPALLVGVVFARLRWVPAWLAHLLSAALAVAWTVQRIAPAMIAEIGRDLGVDTAARLDTWVDQATEIMIRTVIWSRILQAGGRGEDIVLYLVALGLLSWALGYTTGWLLFRSYHAWWAVVLNAALILINYTYAWPKPNVLFFLFLGAALLLIAYQQVVTQQHSWSSAQVEYPEYLPWRFMIAAAVFCGLVVLATSLLPSNISSTQVARAWQVMSAPFTYARDTWNAAFSTIQAPPGTSGGGFTTRSVRVGGGRILRENVVMRVRSPKFDYWRAVAFDRYTGSGWQSNIGERARVTLGALTAEEARTPIEAGTLMSQGDLKGRTLITQTVEVVQQRNDRLIMVGGQAASVGLPVYVQNGFLPGDDGKLRPNFTETAAIFTRAALLDTQTYTITSYYANADEQSLREAGTIYPAWVTENYLPLPDSVTERTRDLARQVTLQASATNPYDQALAIENELRRLTYDERRPLPVDHGDWVDYFLFEIKRGYCDDFATAFVVLMRSIGVPARWVQGYAGGTIDPSTGQYVVRENLAHSWPEVYFPGFGWQRFEPTPASYATPPVRPAVPENDTGPEIGGATGAIPPAPPEDEINRRRIRELNEEQAGDVEALQREIEARRLAEQRQQLLLTGGVLALLAVSAGLFMLWWRRDLRGLSPAAAAYLRVHRLAGWAGLPQPESVTPYEFGAELSHALPEQRRAIERITRAYVAERYGVSRRSSPEDLEDSWRGVRGALLRHWVRRLVPQRGDR